MTDVMKYVLILMLFIMSCTSEKESSQVEVSDFENTELSEEQKIAAFLVGKWELVSEEPSESKMVIRMTEDECVFDFEDKDDLHTKYAVEQSLYPDGSLYEWGAMFEYDRTEEEMREMRGDLWADSEPVDPKERSHYSLVFIDENQIVWNPNKAKHPSSTWRRVSKDPTGAKAFVEKIKLELEVSKQKEEEKRAKWIAEENARYMASFKEVDLSKKGSVRRFRYHSEKEKDFVYLEPGCFRAEAFVEVLKTNTYEVHLVDNVRYARYLLKLPDKDSLSFIVKTDGNGKIIEIKAAE